MASAELPSGENPVPPLRVIDLTKWYGEEFAIDRVTFSASASEILSALSGQNRSSAKGIARFGRTTSYGSVEQFKVQDGFWLMRCDQETNSCFPLRR
jgi:hypothetical protein